MEVVCLILVTMLASQPCSHAFWVLTSLHLLSFLLLNHNYGLETRMIIDKKIIAHTEHQITVTLRSAYTGEG